MKEKKNIDRLFQEQLKDFEATPNAQVWLNIEAELKKDKKKRRLIPFWLQYSGIAAALVLGFFILKPFFEKELSTVNSRIANEQKENQTRGTNKEPLLKNDSQIIKEQEVVTTTETSSKTESNQNSLNAYTKNTKDNQIQTTTQKEKSKSLTQNTFTIKKETEIAEIAENKPKTIQNSDKSNVITNQNDKNNTVPPTPIDDTEAKKSETKTAEETNELEEILKTKTENKTKLATVSKSRWQISPTIAPVYLNTNSGGSPIDNQFSNNEKRADKSLSYGLGINYAISSKITIRTGINKVVLGYNTNDVSYSAGLSTQSIANINYHPTNAVEIKNQANYNSLTSSEKNIQNTSTGAINQKMGYYELPLEVSYALLDKKFGISLIGGFSTLFLDENKISLVSSQSNVELGEANNLNKIHLSSNFGVGFRYQLIPSVQFHFEPTIKYQMNTFSGQSNNFKPVFLGLYSGVSYRF